MPEKIKEFYLFEEFRLDAENPGLWRNGELVAVPPKALELLILLVENHGEIVSNDQLLDTVWKDTFVEVGNISYTVSILRKTLGKKEFIKSVPRRGYRFTAEVKKIAENVEEIAEFQPDFKSKLHSRRTLLAILLTAVILLTSFAFYSRYATKNRSVIKNNIKSIAILPFKSLNQSEKNDAVSLGLTSILISRFGSLNRFTVRPFDAVRKFSTSDSDSLKFGAELKVDAVLEGTFHTENERLRVTARLLDVRDGTQIWTGNFDETEADFFSLQEKLASEVAQSLILEITASEREILSKQYTKSPEAFRAFSRGRAILDQRKQANFDAAENEFQKAVALDPTFALAYTGLADVYAFRGFYSPQTESVEHYKKAKLFAYKSLELDDNLAEGYALIGRIKRIHDWDWEGAEIDLKRAIELNPNFADAYLYYAQLLMFQARFDEAEKVLKKGLNVDSISQRIFSAQFPLLESVGKYDEGLQFAQELYKTQRENPISQRALATFLFHKAEYTEVIKLIEPLLEIKDDQMYVWYSLLTTSYQRLGNAEKSWQLLNKLEENSATDTKALYSLAINYAELNQLDEAFAALEKCFATREERMVWIKVEPRFANLRTDSRFQELLKKMRLE